MVVVKYLERLKGKIIEIHPNQLLFLLRINGVTLFDKFVFEIVPENYPPLINYLSSSESDLSFNLSEDTSLLLN